MSNMHTRYLGASAEAYPIDLGNLRRINHSLLLQPPRCKKCNNCDTQFESECPTCMQKIKSSERMVQMSRGPMKTMMEKRLENAKKSVEGVYWTEQESQNVYICGYCRKLNSQANSTCEHCNKPTMRKSKGESDFIVPCMWAEDYDNGLNCSVRKFINRPWPLQYLDLYRIKESGKNIEDSSLWESAIMNLLDYTHVLSTLKSAVSRWGNVYNWVKHECRNWKQFKKDYIGYHNDQISDFTGEQRFYFVHCTYCDTENYVDEDCNWRGRAMGEERFAGAYCGLCGNSLRYIYIEEGIISSPIKEIPIQHMSEFCDVLGLGDLIKMRYGDYYDNLSASKQREVMEHDLALYKMYFDRLKSAHVNVNPLLSTYDLDQLYNDYPGVILQKNVNSNIQIWQHMLEVNYLLKMHVNSNSKICVIGALNELNHMNVTYYKPVVRILRKDSKIIDNLNITGYDCVLIDYGGLGLTMERIKQLVDNNFEVLLYSSNYDGTGNTHNTHCPVNTWYDSCGYLKLVVHGMKEVFNFNKYLNDMLLKNEIINEMACSVVSKINDTCLNKIVIIKEYGSVRIRGFIRDEALDIKDLVTNNIFELLLGHTASGKVLINKQLFIKLICLQLVGVTKEEELKTTALLYSKLKVVEGKSVKPSLNLSPAEVIAHVGISIVAFNEIKLKAQTLPLVALVEPLLSSILPEETINNVKKSLLNLPNVSLNKSNMIDLIMTSKEMAVQELENDLETSCVHHRESCKHELKANQCKCCGFYYTNETYCECCQPLAYKAWTLTNLLANTALDNIKKLTKRKQESTHIDIKNKPIIELPNLGGDLKISELVELKNLVNNEFFNNVALGYYRLPNSGKGVINRYALYGMTHGHANYQMLEPILLKDNGLDCAFSALEYYTNVKYDKKKARLDMHLKEEQMLTRDEICTIYDSVGINYILLNKNNTCDIKRNKEHNLFYVFYMMDNHISPCMIRNTYIYCDKIIPSSFKVKDQEDFFNKCSIENMSGDATEYYRKLITYLTDNRDGERFPGIYVNKDNIELEMGYRKSSVAFSSGINGLLHLEKPNWKSLEDDMWKKHTVMTSNLDDIEKDALAQIYNILYELVKMKIGPADVNDPRILRGFRVRCEKENNLYEVCYEKASNYKLKLKSGDIIYLTTNNEQFEAKFVKVVNSHIYIKDLPKEGVNNYTMYISTMSFASHFILMANLIETLPNLHKVVDLIKTKTKYTAGYPGAGKTWRIKQLPLTQNSIACAMGSGAVNRLREVLLSNSACNVYSIENLRLKTKKELVDVDKLVIDEVCTLKPIDVAFIANMVNLKEIYVYGDPNQVVADHFYSRDGKWTVKHVMFDIKPVERLVSVRRFGGALFNAYKGLVSDAECACEYESEFVYKSLPRKEAISYIQSIQSEANICLTFTTKSLNALLEQIHDVEVNKVATVQGQEWDSVIIYQEETSNGYKIANRLDYVITALSRAKLKLIWVNAYVSEKLATWEDLCYKCKQLPNDMKMYMLKYGDLTIEECVKTTNIEEMNKLVCLLRQSFKSRLTIEVENNVITIKQTTLGVQLTIDMNNRTMNWEGFAAGMVKLMLSGPISNLMKFIPSRDVAMPIEFKSNDDLIKRLSNILSLIKEVEYIQLGRITCCDSYTSIYVDMSTKTLNANTIEMRNTIKECIDKEVDVNLLIKCKDTWLKLEMIIKEVCGLEMVLGIPGAYLQPEEWKAYNVDTIVQYHADSMFDFKKVGENYSNTVIRIDTSPDNILTDLELLVGKGWNIELSQYASDENQTVDFIESLCVVMVRADQNIIGNKQVFFNGLNLMSVINNVSTINNIIIPMNDKLGFSYYQDRLVKTVNVIKSYQNLVDSGRFKFKYFEKLVDDAFLICGVNLMAYDIDGILNVLKCGNVMVGCVLFDKGDGSEAKNLFYVVDGKLYSTHNQLPICHVKVYFNDLLLNTNIDVQVLNELGNVAVVQLSFKASKYVHIIKNINSTLVQLKVLDVDVSTIDSGLLNKRNLIVTKHMLNQIAFAILHYNYDFKKVESYIGTLMDSATLVQHGLRYKPGNQLKEILLLVPYIALGLKLMENTSIQILLARAVKHLPLLSTVIPIILGFMNKLFNKGAEMIKILRDELYGIHQMGDLDQNMNFSKLITNRLSNKALKLLFKIVKYSLNMLNVVDTTWCATMELKTNSINDIDRGNGKESELIDNNLQDKGDIHNLNGNKTIENNMETYMNDRENEINTSSNNNQQHAGDEDHREEKNLKVSTEFEKWLDNRLMAISNKGELVTRYLQEVFNLANMTWDRELINNIKEINQLEEKGDFVNGAAKTLLIELEERGQYVTKYEQLSNINNNKSEIDEIGRENHNINSQKMSNKQKFMETVTQIALNINEDVTKIDLEKLLNELTVLKSIRSLVEKVSVIKQIKVPQWVSKCKSDADDINELNNHAIANMIKFLIKYNIYPVITMEIPKSKIEQKSKLLNYLDQSIDVPKVHMPKQPSKPIEIKPKDQELKEAGFKLVNKPEKKRMLVINTPVIHNTNPFKNLKIFNGDRVEDRNMEKRDEPKQEFIGKEKEKKRKNQIWTIKGNLHIMKLPSFMKKFNDKISISAPMDVLFMGSTDFICVMCEIELNDKNKEWLENHWNVEKPNPLYMNFDKLKTLETKDFKTCYWFISKFEFSKVYGEFSYPINSIIPLKIKTMDFIEYLNIPICRSLDEFIEPMKSMNHKCKLDEFDKLSEESKTIIGQCLECEEKCVNEIVVKCALCEVVANIDNRVISKRLYHPIIIDFNDTIKSDRIKKNIELIISGGNNHSSNALISLSYNAVVMEGIRQIIILLGEEDEETLEYYSKFIDQMKTSPSNKLRVYFYIKDCKFNKELLTKFMRVNMLAENLNTRDNQILLTHNSRIAIQHLHLGVNYICMDHGFNKIVSELMSNKLSLNVGKSRNTTLQILKFLAANNCKILNDFIGRVMDVKYKITYYECASCSLHKVEYQSITGSCVRDAINYFNNNTVDRIKLDIDVSIAPKMYTLLKSLLMIENVNLAIIDSATNKGLVMIHNRKGRVNDLIYGLIISWEKSCYHMMVGSVAIDDLDKNTKMRQFIDLNDKDYKLNKLQIKQIETFQLGDMNDHLIKLLTLNKVDGTVAKLNSGSALFTIYKEYNGKIILPYVHGSYFGRYAVMLNGEFSNLATVIYNHVSKLHELVVGKQIALPKTGLCLILHFGLKEGVSFKEQVKDSKWIAYDSVNEKILRSYFTKKEFMINLRKEQSNERTMFLHEFDNKDHDNYGVYNWKMHFITKYGELDNDCIELLKTTHNKDKRYILVNGVLNYMMTYSSITECQAARSIIYSVLDNVEVYINNKSLWFLASNYEIVNEVMGMVLGKAKNVIELEDNMELTVNTLFSDGKSEKANAELFKLKGYINLGETKDVGHVVIRVNKINNENLIVLQDRYSYRYYATKLANHLYDIVNNQVYVIQKLYGNWNEMVDLIKSGYIKNELLNSVKWYIHWFKCKVEQFDKFFSDVPAKNKNWRIFIGLVKDIMSCLLNVVGLMKSKIIINFLYSLIQLIVKRKRALNIKTDWTFIDWVFTLLNRRDTSTQFILKVTSPNFSRTIKMILDLLMCASSVLSPKSVIILGILKYLYNCVINTNIWAIRDQPFRMLLKFSTWVLDIYNVCDWQVGSIQYVASIFAKYVFILVRKGIRVLSQQTAEWQGCFNNDNIQFNERVDHPLLSDGGKLRTSLKRSIENIVHGDNVVGTALTLGSIELRFGKVLNASKVRINKYINESVLESNKDHFSLMGDAVCWLYNIVNPASELTMLNGSVFVDLNVKNSFYDQKNNLLYIAVADNEDLDLKNKELYNKGYIMVSFIQQRDISTFIRDLYFRMDLNSYTHADKLKEILNDNEHGFILDTHTNAKDIINYCCDKQEIILSPNLIIASMAGVKRKFLEKYGNELNFIKLKYHCRMNGFEVQLRHSMSWQPDNDVLIIDGTSFKIEKITLRDSAIISPIYKCYKLIKENIEIEASVLRHLKSLLKTDYVLGYGNLEYTSNLAKSYKIEEVIGNEIFNKSNIEIVNVLPTVKLSCNLVNRYWRQYGESIFIKNDSNLMYSYKLDNNNNIINTASKHCNYADDINSNLQKLVNDYKYGKNDEFLKVCGKDAGLKVKGLFIRNISNNENWFNDLMENGSLDITLLKPERELKLQYDNFIDDEEKPLVKCRLSIKKFSARSKRGIECNNQTCYIKILDDVKYILKLEKVYGSYIEYMASRYIKEHIEDLKIQGMNTQFTPSDNLMKINTLDTEIKCTPKVMSPFGKGYCSCEMCMCKSQTLLPSIDSHSVDLTFNDRIYIDEITDYHYYTNLFFNEDDYLIINKNESGKTKLYAHVPHMSKGHKTALINKLPDISKPALTNRWLAAKNAYANRVANVQRFQKYKLNVQREAIETAQIIFQQNFPYMSEYFRNNPVSFSVDKTIEWLKEHPQPNMKQQEILDWLNGAMNIRSYTDIKIFAKLESFPKWENVNSKLDVSERIIMGHYYFVSAIFSPVFNEIKHRFKLSLNNKIKYVDGLTEEEIIQEYNNIEYDGDEWLFEDDASKQDRQTTHDLIDIEFLIYNMLGLSDRVAELWREIHNNWKAYCNSFRTFNDAMRITGSATTALGNVVVNTVVHKDLIRKYWDTMKKTMVLGDDHHGIYKVKVNTDIHNQMSKKKYNMETKSKCSKRVSTMLRHIVFFDENNKIRFEPDVVRLSGRLELMNNNISDDEKIYLRKLSYNIMIGGEPCKFIKKEHESIIPKAKVSYKGLKATASYYNLPLGVVENCYNKIKYILNNNEKRLIQFKVIS